MIGSETLSCPVVRRVSSSFDTGHILCRVLRVRDPISRHIFHPCTVRLTHIADKCVDPGRLWVEMTYEGGEPRPAQVPWAEGPRSSAWVEAAQWSM